MRNEDSHHLRADLGPVPNIHHSGNGSGLQLEGVVEVQLTDLFSVGLGARYWKLESDGTVRFGTPPGAPQKLNELDSERVGMFVQAKLKLN